MAKDSLELVLYDPNEFDLWAIDAYSEDVTVSTVDIEFPVVPGLDWEFFDEATVNSEATA